MSLSYGKAKKKAGVAEVQTKLPNMGLSSKSAGRVKLAERFSGTIAKHMQKTEEAEA